MNMNRRGKGGGEGGAGGVLKPKEDQKPERGTCMTDSVSQ